eukprot:TRINITY_DN7026_c0_g1_i1.p1 TRINITY_DN7026_c0_g1~~TRINITY_DN7026_c0_g1_i1.p1  ORF type:complete len:315 (+),score=76.27 TRINITY_DN7026_c0_g1_i1:569-1513(+)
MSPEVLLGDELNEKADIYAYSIVIWELFIGEEPFQEYEELDPFIDAVCFNDVRPPIPDSVNPTIKSLLEKGWAKSMEDRPSCSEIMVILEEALLEGLLHDNVARNMWHEQWGKIGQVPFEDFARVLYAATNSKYPHYPEYDDKYKCLEAILSENHEVTMEKFGVFLDWFGNCDTELLNTFLDVMKQEWFHGDLDRNDTEAKLSDFDTKKGTFLVRFSSRGTKTTPFTISKVDRKGTIIHMRVRRGGRGGYKLSFKKHGKVNSITQPTLPALIASAKSSVGLSKPCPGRSFAKIFHKKVGTYDIDDESTDESYSF